MTPDPDQPRADRIDELGRIILAYSEMTERLEQSQNRLVETVARLQEELSEKSRLLERRNRLAALGEMAAGMAHEIRNPLGGIGLYAAMLDADLADRPEQRKIVGKIAAGVRRLEGVVGGVLQFTREIAADPRPCDARAVVAEAVELSSTQAAAAGVTVEVVGPASLPAVADADLLGRAVLNLLLNAIDAAVGRVVVTIFGDAGDLQITVADDGPGVAAGALDKIFDPFFTTKDAGTGLGLSIVHRITEAHGGRVSATNADGGGAVFEIVIPGATADPGTPLNRIVKSTSPTASAASLILPLLCASVPLW